MVTRVKNDINNKPFINLDFKNFSSSYSADNVREVLKSRVGSAPVLPEGIEQNDTGAKILFSKAEIAYKSAVAELELFENNQELYTSLYGIKEAANQNTVTTTQKDENGENKEVDVDASQAKFCQDQNGNLFLAVDLLKPTDISFQIHNGKLVFDLAGLSPDKLREMISFLEHRGLLSCVNMDDLKLENASPELEEMFQDLKDKNKDIAANDAQNPVIHESVASDMPGDAPANDQNATDTPTELTPAPENAKIDLNKAPDGAYNTAIESLTKWMDKNRRRNLSYFVTSKGDYTVFTVFNKENPDNMDLDNIIDPKTKDIKTRNECKLYIRMTKDGKLEVSYSTVEDKLNDNFADRIMDAYKDVGIKRVKFGPIGDQEEAVIRAACARALIVPVDIKLSQTKFEKMIDAAEGKNGKNNPKVYKYKHDLAMQMAYVLQNKGIKWNDPKNKNDAECRCIRHAIGAYQFSPFRDWWEDFGLRSTYEDVIKNNSSSVDNGAAASIGAVQGVSKLFSAYSEAMGYSAKTTVDFFASEQCNSFSAEQKNKIRPLIESISGTPLRDLPEKSIKEIFGVLKETEESVAKRNIENEYRKLINNQFYKGNAARDAVTPYVEEANQNIRNVGGAIADFGLPQMLIINVGKPKHDFTAIQQDYKQQGNRNNDFSTSPFSNQDQDDDRHDYQSQGNQDNQGSQGYRGHKDRNDQDGQGYRGHKDRNDQDGQGYRGHKDRNDQDGQGYRGHKDRNDQDGQGSQTNQGQRPYTKKADRTY